MMDYLDVKRDDINYAILHGDAMPLMENAGRCIAELVRRVIPAGSKICAVCGTGNNGGDGVAALEGLREDYEVTAVIVKGRSSVKTREAKIALKNYKGRVEPFRSLPRILSESDAVLDAVFGIGISGEPRPPYAEAIHEINGCGKPVISVDVPSGMGTKVSVKPDYTVTFTDVKEGMDPSNSGKIEVCDIGIPEEVRNYAGPGDLVYYRQPSGSSHKGMNGTLAILGGWEYYGSSVISGLAALSMATDLVRIYVSGRNYQIVASYSPYLIVRDTSALEGKWEEELLSHRAVLVGPGMGQGKESLNAMKEVVKKSRSPLVIDADGIKLASTIKGSLSGKMPVFTPHHREFQILAGEGASKDNAEAFARKNGCIIVLKGEEDVVTDGKRTIIVRGGNPRMTMGGTGDMLAGIIAACASRGIEPFRAAVMGAYINKKAAERAYELKSYWYGIDDMLESVPAVMKGSIEWASGNRKR